MSFSVGEKEENHALSIKFSPRELCGEKGRRFFKEKIAALVAR